MSAGLIPCEGGGIGLLSMAFYTAILEDLETGEPSYFAAVAESQSQERAERWGREMAERHRYRFVSVVLTEED